MAKSQQTFNKKEKEKKRLKKKQEKREKREERKLNAVTGELENMMAYIDENGNITDSPPDPSKKKEFIAENIVLGVPIREDIEEDPVKVGFIEFFNTEKGFGFIKEEGTNEKFFVHVHGLIDEVREGNKVSFELEKGLKGMNAVRVTIVKDKPKPQVEPKVEGAEEVKAEATEEPKAEATDETKVEKTEKSDEEK